MSKENSKSVPIIHHPHDMGYKHLLSSKKVFLELLQSFVNAGWVDNIDESNMIKVNKSYVTPDFNAKESDLVYRLKMKDKDVIFYLLLELQSTVDFTMPFRLLSYMVGIWRDILKDITTEEFSKKSFRLPAIIPVVLYNGEQNWTACTSFKEILSGYEEFQGHILNFDYFLIDVNRYKPDDLKALSNFISAIFLLDQKYDIMELDERLIAVAKVLQNLDSNQFQQFKSWFTKIICNDLTKENFDSVVNILENSSPEEVETLITSNLAKTLRKAQEDAKLQGLAEGNKQKQIEIAKRMLQRNLPLDAIADITELPLEEISKLATEAHN